MKQRIITGTILIALLVPILIFSDTYVFPIAFTLLALIGTWEMLRCVGTVKSMAVAIPSFLFTLAVTVGARWITGRNAFAWTYIGAVFFFFVVISIFSIFSKGKIPVDSMFSSFGGVFYVGSAFAALILLRYSNLGEYLFLFAFILPIVSDTFAYFTGVFFGKHKLIPDVSPKKTVEGSIGGIVFSGLACVLAAWIILKDSTAVTMSVPYYLAIFGAGAAVAFLSQIGDLLASLIKRRYDVKDYSMLFPGHGGVMDRFDSILITSPLLLVFSLALEYFGFVQL